MWGSSCRCPSVWWLPLPVVLGTVLGLFPLGSSVCSLLVLSETCCNKTGQTRVPEEAEVLGQQLISKMQLFGDQKSLNVSVLESMSLSWCSSCGSQWGENLGTAAPCFGTFLPVCLRRALSFVRTAASLCCADGRETFSHNGWHSCLKTGVSLGTPTRSRGGCTPSTARTSADGG